MKKEETLKYPKCPKCGQAMVYTFAFPGAEYACLPCNTKAGYFNSLEKIERSEKYMDSKKRKWSKDLTWIARNLGGARCAICVDGSCEYCKIASNKDYKFEYWTK